MFLEIPGKLEKRKKKKAILTSRYTRDYPSTRKQMLGSDHILSITAGL
jgi:hypothetical protein